MSEQIISKRCSRCKEIKTVSEFSGDRTKKDGFQSECKICGSDNNKAYRKTEKGKIAHRKAVLRYNKTEKGRAIHKKGNKKYGLTEKFKISQKRYNQTAKGKTALRRALKKYQQSEKGKAAYKRFHARHPNHRKAMIAVKNAIKAGKLARSNSRLCHYCPKPAKQYHHWHGYAKEHWLDVIPVCVSCHNNLP